MYDIAETLLTWRAEGRDATVAVLLETRGISSAEPGASLAWSAGESGAGSGGESVGSLAALADRVTSAQPGIVDVPISADDAARAGLACGGALTLLVRPLADFPGETWSRLAAGEPLCLVAGDDGIQVHTPASIRDVTAFGDTVGRLFGRGVTAATRLDGPAAAVAFWPVPSLLVVGDGLIAAALCAQAGLLGWPSSAVGDVPSALSVLATSRHSDAVVVLSHDRAVDGPVLAAALDCAVGYVGALGSRRTQAARRDWLTRNGTPGDAVQRIHGPAGLDVDAHTPAEIAVSIAAEILAARAGSQGTPLRERPGPVHVAGVQAPPPR